MTTPITCKDRLEQYLREQGVAYEVQHHPLAYTARRCRCERARASEGAGKDSSRYR